MSNKRVRVAYGARLGLRNLWVTTVLGSLGLGTPLFADQITVTALGDSLTQGFGLPENDGLVPQLQAWLQANGHPEVVVLNAGVSGDTTSGGAARVAWTLTEDVDAMIVALGGNDVLRGLDPALSRVNIARILSEAAARDVPVLLSGMRAPGNFGPDYKAAFDAIYPALAEEYNVILHPFFLEGLGAGADVGAARALMQPDGIHPNAEGVARIVAEMGPYVSTLIGRARN